MLFVLLSQPLGGLERGKGRGGKAKLTCHPTQKWQCKLRFAGELFRLVAQ